MTENSNGPAKWPDRLDQQKKIQRRNRHVEEHDDCIRGVGSRVVGRDHMRASAQTKLKWAHVYETSEPFHTASVWAAGRSTSAPTAAIRSTSIPASQLGKETDINQGLSLGSVDMIISGSSFAAKSYPPIGVTYYPYTFRDAGSSAGLHQERHLQGADQGLRGQDRPPHRRGDLLRRAPHLVEQPIKPCADMKGLKMRVPDVPAYLAMPRACGANTAPIAFAEVYLALQNGTVEAQENPLTTIEAKKFYEVQKHIVLTGHIVDHLNTVMPAGSGRNCPRRTARSSPRWRRKRRRRRRPRSSRSESQAGRFLQGEGPDRDRGRQERVPRRGARRM